MLKENMRTVRGSFPNLKRRSLSAALDYREYMVPQAVRLLSLLPYLLGTTSTCVRTKLLSIRSTTLSHGQEMALEWRGLHIKVIDEAQARELSRLWAHLMIGLWTPKVQGIPIPAVITHEMEGQHPPSPDLLDKQLS